MRTVGKKLAMKLCRWFIPWIQGAKKEIRGSLKFNHSTHTQDIHIHIHMGNHNHRGDRVP